MTDAPTERCGYISEYSEEDGGHSACCYRETWGDRDRCVWHAEVKEEEKKPLDELRATRETEQNQLLKRGQEWFFPLEILDGARLTGVVFHDRASFSFADCVLRNGDLSGADLTGADLSRANLSGANLSGADLFLADLSEAYLMGVDLSWADLSVAGLREAVLFEADLSWASLFEADLSGAGLSGADLLGADLQGTNFSGTVFTQATKFGRQSKAEQDASSPGDWDEIARAYHTVKTRLSEQGLVGKARRQYLEERRARRLEAKAGGGRKGYTAFALSWLSRYVAGYGVDPRPVVGIMLLIFAIPTLVYWNAGIDHSLYYSAVTFVDTPPSDIPPLDSMVAGVVLIQMFLGTLSIVLLGYVLGARESI